MPAARPAGASSRSARARASSVAALSAARRGEHERGGALAQAERLEPAREVGAVEVAGHHRGQHVAGQPALGVVGHAAAQQLERHDRHGLVQREAVELGQLAAVLGRQQPRLRRRPVAAGAARRALLRRARDRQRERAAGQLAAGRVAAAAAGLCALAQLLGERGDRRVAQRRAGGAPGQHLAAGVEDDRRAADQRRQRAGHAVEPALGEHDPLEPLVRGERALEDRVVLVDEVREGLLGDGDERHLVGHLEQREAELVGGLDHRLGHRRVGEARAEPEAGQPVAREPRDVLALGVGALELEARGQQQLAARQPRRGVDDLGDVHPADRAVDARLSRHQPDVEVAQEITQGQHGVTDRRPSYAGSDKLLDRRQPAQRPPRRSTVRRVTLAYDRQGEGPPLLLLHGLGSCKEMWRPLIRRSRASARWWRWTCPASAPRRAGRDTVEGLAEALAEFAAGLGLERPHVAGNSLGGGVALTMGAMGAASSVCGAVAAGLRGEPRGDVRARDAGRARAYWPSGSPRRRRRWPQRRAAHAAVRPRRRPAVAHPGRGRRALDADVRRRPPRSGTCSRRSTAGARRRRPARRRSRGASATGC